MHRRSAKPTPDDPTENKAAKFLSKAAVSSSAFRQLIKNEKAYCTTTAIVEETAYCKP